MAVAKRLDQVAAARAPAAAMAAAPPSFSAEGEGVGSIRAPGASSNREVEATV